MFFSRAARESAMPVPSNPKQLTRSARAAFWQAVKDCLVEFHRQSLNKATSEVTRLRRELEEAPNDIDRDAVYHSEPFYVACDLSGISKPRDQDALLDVNRVKYKSMLEHLGW